MKPEFLTPNILNSKASPGISSVFDIGGGAYTPIDEKCLTDHRAEPELITSGATSFFFRVKYTFTGSVSLDRIKLLNTNVDEYAILGKLGANTLIDLTGNNSQSSMHIVLSQVYEIDYLEIQLITTQTPGEEKIIGEIYAGCLEMQPSSSLVDYKGGSVDPKRIDIPDMENYSRIIKSNPVFRANMLFSGLTKSEHQWVKDFVMYGGEYVFCPSAGDIGICGIHEDFSFDEIRLVSTPDDFSCKPFGLNGSGELPLSIKEARL